ncbi:MAG: uracil-DNA glycosylase [Anaerolineae bacterium]|nr:uracil-DNA glycosylase [Anaerolineae bacterium]
MIAEADSFYMQTTIQAFAQAGVSVSSMADIMAMGIYLTTAIKCAKVDYGVPAGTIRTCSELLQREIALFPNVRAFLLMGDFAIKALNDIARREVGKRAIPSGSTYKIRGDAYYFKDARAFPSYLQTGKSFLIEKSKQHMIAEDIRAALNSL